MRMGMVGSSRCSFVLLVSAAVPRAEWRLGCTLLLRVGAIDILDAVAILFIIKTPAAEQAELFSDCELAASDANESGGIDVIDAVQVISVITG